MIDSSTEQKKAEGAKLQFLLTGFTQAAGIRIYAFEGRVDARRIGYTVEVDLALIAGYGIRIQDLPLLCRELLQQRAQSEPDDISVFVFTEPRMRSHADKLASEREEAERRKKQPRHLPRAQSQTGWRLLPLR